MPLELDGARVLRALLDAPDVFPEAGAELNRLAHGLVVKQLRTRQLTIEGLRRVADCLGYDSFRLIADAMSDAEVKTLALRMDPHNLLARKADPGSLRSHLLALAEGDLEPQPEPRAAARPADAPAAARTMSSRAMAAVARPRDDAPVKAKSKSGKAKPGKAKGKSKKKGKG